MPHLKFTRDHRGYENTFLFDTIRRRGREQSRVLYWFRSPPQVKVGRAAIDEDAIRALEDAYPAVTFDWTRILEARLQDPEPAGDDPRRRQRPRGARDQEGRPDARSERSAPPWPSSAPPVAAAIRQPGPVETPIEAAPPAAADSAEPAVAIDAQPAAPEPGDFLGDEAEAASEPEAEEPSTGPSHASEPSAAERILGSEGLSRLRGRHAEVCARIAAQVAEPVRQAALRMLAEGLNPDAWVTDGEVRSGLEQFEQVLDQIRREVGPLRRRTRRGGRRNRRRREGLPAGAAPQPDGTAPRPSPTGDEDDGPDAGEA